MRDGGDDYCIERGRGSHKKKPSEEEEKYELGQEDRTAILCRISLKFWVENK